MNKWIIAALIIVLSQSAAAQEDELRNLPGYVAFGELTSVYGEPKVMVNIGGVLLGFMSAATRDDPEAAKLLEGLKGVRINVYSTAGQPAPALEQVENVKTMLQDDDWEPVVRVKESEEVVHIFMKADEEGVHGLVVMAVDNEEAVFINILGMIDPSKLDEVVDQFDVDVDV